MVDDDEDAAVSSRIMADDMSQMSVLNLADDGVEVVGDHDDEEDVIG